MPHTIEPATSGRAKCRGCGQKIAKGESRLGERLPNPFAEEGDMTLWFHPRCGAYKRPEVLLEALDAGGHEIAERAELILAAETSRDHPRLARFDGAERAKSGRAKCRHCHEKITKGAWRLRLVFYAEGRFEPMGTIHAGCAADYFGCTAVVDRLRHMSPDLDEADLKELEAEL